MRCQKLEPGDLVLVKQKGSSGNYNIDDKWETNRFRVEEQLLNENGKLMPVIKLFEIVQSGAPRRKTLHHNMLYPYHSVEGTDGPILVRANLLMDWYFSEW